MQQAYACVMWFPYAGHIEDRWFNYIDYIWELYANAILILCGICQLMYDQLNVWSKVLTSMAEARVASVPKF